MKVLREGPVRITMATIETAWRRRSKDQRIIIGDANQRGLALVVNANGLSWRYDFKPRGLNPATGKRFASQSISIGNPETHSPDQARHAAGQFKGQAKAGQDPAAERRAAIAASAEKRGRTVDRLVQAYAEALPLRGKLRGSGPASPDYVMREIGRVRAAVTNMKAWGRPITDLTDQDVRALLRATASEPGAARHRFGAFSRLMDWCRDEGLVTSNPCSGIGKDRRPKPIPARQNFLHIAALATLWKAAGEAEGLQPVHRDFVRFLLAIPCRRGEAANLDWSHLNLAGAEWTQPGQMTKNGDAHRLHLHKLALNLLVSRHDAAGKPKAGLVFPSPKSDQKPLTTFSALKADLDEAAGLVGWRMHDIRRSFATALAEAGVSEVVADGLLNHRQSASRGGVLGTYQRATHRPAQVRAMTLWGDMLAAAIEGRDSSAEKVVPMAGGQRRRSA